MDQKININEMAKKLSDVGIPDFAFSHIISGANFYRFNSGKSLFDIFNTNEFLSREEYYVILSSYLSLVGLSHNIKPKNEWRLKFDCAFLLQTKSIMQSSNSLDLLTKNCCYNDAFAICRTLISRLNLLLIFALNPDLFDEWLKNPKDEKFLDGHIRKELSNNGISTVDHLYELTSEIIHYHHDGLVNSGYFEKGGFVEIPGVSNQIYVIAKFVLGMMFQTVISMIIQDYDGESLPEDIGELDKLFNWFLNSYLVSNRYDHIFTFFAEDRHWEKVGKNKYKFWSEYNFIELRNQIIKFHRNNQKKKLSKKYCI